MHADLMTYVSERSRVEHILGLPVLPKEWNTVVKITPAKAKMILEAMPPQRPLNRKKVEWFAHLINTDRFRTTHQGMAVNTRGEMIDGQHRLHACVLTEKPIFVQISFNQPTDNFFAYDGKGATRTLADHLITEGAASAPAIASLMQSAGKIIWHYDAGRAPFTMTPPFDLIDIHEVLTRHPLLIPTAEYCLGQSLLRPRPPMGVVVGLGTLFREVDDTMALLFIEQILTGRGLQERDPAEALRRTLGSSQKLKITRNNFMGRMVHAWNNVRSGRKVKSLMSAAHDGSFPKIDGYKSKG